ncbi:hypothetical protein C1646_773844, partial [Rhizophagus diaphanus]
MSYNKNTIEKWLEYVKLTRKEGGEIYPSSRKKRSKELIKIREKEEKLIDVIIASIRYRNRPEYRKMGIALAIKVIYDELDIRFTKFEEWLEDIEIAIVKNRGYNTMKYFKEILHMEESIAEEENREKVKKFQKKESEDSDEHYEMILRNYWIENGYKIDIKEIKRILDFGVEYEVMKTKDFMEYYVVIKELNDEEIVKELKKWYSTNIIECPLCQKMILIKEAIDYNKEFEGRICKSCFEKEENNNKIELRIERIMKICERAEIKLTREKIIQVLKMGYEDKEIVSWGFIELFQENKNKSEEAIKEILDKYLKKEMNTEENENEETTNEITETEERLSRIKGLIEYSKIEATEGELLMLIRMGYTDSDIIRKEFIEKFQANKEKSGEGIKRILDEYLRKFNDDHEEINEENELSIEEMVQKLMKERDEVQGEVTEIEIRKLLEWGYNSRVILSNRIIFQYRKLKMELDPYKEDDKEVKEKLRDYILEVEEDDYDTDNSEKIGEILSPGEHEEWDENIENIGEDEIKNNINTGDFGSSQNSDSNNSLNIKDSDNKSGIFDYNLQELFQKEILNMATENQMKRIVENALGLPANALNAPLGAGVNIAERIENAGNEAGGAIIFLLFYGKEEEDVNDWIKQFEVAFTAIGKAPGNNGTRQAAYAATCLKGAAAQWYNEMKETNNGNLINWADADNDNDLKHRIKQRFTREDVRRRKMLEIATRGHAMDNVYQVDFYIRGLELTIGYNVRRQNPADLNGAINLARREEEAKDELIRKVSGDRIYPDIGRGNEQRQDNEPRNIINKPLNENYKDELVEVMNNMKIKKIERQIRNMERLYNNNGNGNQRNNYRTPINWDEVICFRCNRKEEDDEESSDDYENSDEEYDLQLYQYNYELYEKDNPIIERRR